MYYMCAHEVGKIMEKTEYFVKVTVGLKPSKMRQLQQWGNLLTRMWKILGNQGNYHVNLTCVTLRRYSVFLHYNCALSLCFIYREVVQQLIEEYQAATRAGYISWGTQQQVS